ncbi:MAG TPA: hypothetical protein VFE47_09575 [Tepidisphaeraceae bacterium]|jgi:hypothetical protein|nr:hypothetical protein [Tepidisphaeraceae bacterium]
MRFSRLRSALYALAIVGCVAVSSRPAVAETAPDRYAGKFQDSRLVVVISIDGANADGIIIKGESRFPLSAHVDEGTLHGTFTSDGNKFEFTATLSGNELTLVTSGKTYVLKNANPLARGPAPAATEPAAPVKPGDIVGKWSIAGDLGDEKFTLTLGPKGDMEVASSNGNSTSGPTYSYEAGVLTFDGGTTINKLSLSGKWKITWKDSDTFATTDDQGKQLTLNRVK